MQIHHTVNLKIEIKIFLFHICDKREVIHIHIVDKLANNELDMTRSLNFLFTHSMCLNKVQCFRRKKNNSYIGTVIGTTNLLEYFCQELFNGNKKLLHERMLPLSQSRCSI